MDAQKNIAFLIQSIFINRFVIMDEFLKNFSLTNDIIRINEQEYFHINFNTEELDQTVMSINNYEKYVYYYEPLNIFLYNLQTVKGKSIFIILKWLIVTHKIIHIVKYPSIFTDIYEALNAIHIDHITDPYEQYLSEKLVKPYMHFIQKLCLLEQKEVLRNYVKNKAEFIQQSCFIKYNLIKFGLGQLSQNVNSFSPFFKECYSFLQHYHILIQADLLRLFKQLKSDFNKDETKLIRQQDMNTLSQCFIKSQSNSLHSEAFIITDITARKEQIASLFESASKDNRLSTVLFPVF